MNDAANRTLDVEVLNIHKGEYLSEALKRQGYPMLPSNAIINKVMTGGKSSVSCPLKPSDSAPLKHSTMPP